MSARATVLLVGTRKGLWIGRSDEARRDWSWTGPHFDMEEVYSCMVDTRHDPPRLLVGRVLELVRAARTPLRRPRRDLGRVGRRRTEVPRVGPGQRRAHLAAHARRHRRRGVRRLGAGRGLALGGPRSDVRAGAGALGPPAPAAVGRRLRGPGLPHDPAAPARPRLGDRGALDRRGLPHVDGGASWHPRNSGIRAEFLPEGQQYPEFGQCVHKVARHPDRPERLYLQNHGGVYRSDDEGGSWTSIADGLPGRLRVPDRGAPARARHRVRLPARRGRAPLPAGGQRRRVALAGRRADMGQARPAGCPRRSSSASCATPCASTTTRPRGSTSGRATARSGPAPTPASSGPRSCRTSPTSSWSAPPPSTPSARGWSDLLREGMVPTGSARG